jgi:hypothetical protein
MRETLLLTLNSVIQQLHGVVVNIVRCRIGYHIFFARLYIVRTKDSVHKIIDSIPQMPNVQHFAQGRISSCCSRSEKSISNRCADAAELAAGAGSQAQQLRQAHGPQVHARGQAQGLAVRPIPVGTRRTRPAPHAPTAWRAARWPWRRRIRPTRATTWIDSGLTRRTRRVVGSAAAGAGSSAAGIDRRITRWDLRWDPRWKEAERIHGAQRSVADIRIAVPTLRVGGIDRRHTCRIGYRPATLGSRKLPEPGVREIGGWPTFCPLSAPS